MDLASLKLDAKHHDLKTADPSLGASNAQDNVRRESAVRLILLLDRPRAPLQEDHSRLWLDVVDETDPVSLDHHAFAEITPLLTRVLRRIFTRVHRRNDHPDAANPALDFVADLRFLTIGIPHLSV